MNNSDPFSEGKLQRSQLFFYLIPILGVLPAIWTLSHPHQSPTAKQVSRLSLTLALTWLASYGFLWLSSSQGSEIISFRLLYLNGLLTSGYFCLCLVLMIRLWQGKLPPNLPSLKLLKPKKL